MTKIDKVVCSTGLTGFFFDDQKAIKAGAAVDGAFYQGAPQTPGFTSIRQPGESISVMLCLSNGQVALGDCVAVQYSGAAGRDPVFLAKDYLSVIDEVIAPVLEGRKLESFTELAEEIDQLKVNGKSLHTALRYGVTQAILEAVALAKHCLPCEVIAEEFKTEIATEPVPVFTQSGDDRYANADKMIIKQIDVLPHGLFNSVEKLGADGSKLLAYLEWLRKRIEQLRPTPDYQPALHIDVYGTIGQAFQNDIPKMVAFFAKLEKAAGSFALSIEGPVDLDDRATQCQTLAELRQQLKAANIKVEIVADEWCNTLDDTRYFADRQAVDMIQIKAPDLGGIQNAIKAALYCKERGVKAYLGGSCNETDHSARICAQIAMAVQPSRILAKPGMGVDEAMMIARNEMARVIALRTAKNS